MFLCCFFVWRKMKKIEFDPISLFVWLWLFVVNGFVCATNYFFAILIHEFGHYITAKNLGYELSRFSISPYGVEISFFNQTLHKRDEFLIAIAGPLANFLSIFFVLAFWWIYPQIYFLTGSFVFISLTLAVFNLLPAYPLDGGRVFISLFSQVSSVKKARIATIVLNIILSIVFFALFVVLLFFNFNPTYLLFAIFLFCGVLDLCKTTKYEKMNIFTKKTKNFSKASMYMIDTNVTLRQLIKRIEVSKNSVFCLVLENGKIVNLSEKFILKLSLNFDIEKNIGEILNIEK